MTKKFVITGPESSGKTTLAKGLSKSLDCELVVEYAREYLMELEGSYTFNDVEVMARKQLELEKKLQGEVAVLDTDLSVYAIWIKEKYGKEIDWINQSISHEKNKIYFLCEILDNWEDDPLREHPSIEDRQRLFRAYEVLLQKHNLTYHVISGTPAERLKKAKEIALDLI